VTANTVISNSFRNYLNFFLKTRRHKIVLCSFKSNIKKKLPILRKQVLPGIEFLITKSSVLRLFYMCSKETATLLVYDHVIEKLIAERTKIELCCR